MLRGRLALVSLFSPGEVSALFVHDYWSRQWPLSTVVPLAAIFIPKENFPLGGAMLEALQGLAVEPEHGKGLAMIRNMPVVDPRLTKADVAVLCVGVSRH